MRSTSSRSIIVAALLASPALAFKDTSPFLLWNTDPSRVFEDASRFLSGSALQPAEEVYGKLSSLGCDWENVVVVNRDNLHFSQLAQLDYPTHDAHLHIPYLSRPQKRGLNNGLESWAESCDAKIVSSFDECVEGEKSVIVLESSRDESFPTLPSDLSEPYILLLTGSGSTPSSSSSQQEKRQERPFPTHITHSASATTTFSAPTSTSTSSPSKHNSTIPSKDAPLLERVQLLTTPIITSLLITFLIFLPILGFGISMLTSIQVPPRMLEIGKTLSVDKGRKDQ